MLELKNVSKFYYSKNVVTSGFSKVNMNLNSGEFIAITGESGSGKSTLLNVISGLDSYEEGEMYINGEETSGYTEKDFENYRKKYIGNIFQNFNLINSYTVYQNIELVLLINGYKKKKLKEIIINTLEKVDLLKYKNTKVSKLSGGQKQRVAIARVLAKETPIIVADEPTGNLDSKTAENIIELLRKVAKDKLIIIVTHNYEQIEKYVTRKITMHDGRIIEDKKIDNVQKIEKISNDKEKSINNENVSQAIQNKKQYLSNINKWILGIRNTFNIKIKFLLLLIVYLFVNVSIVAGYSALKKQEYEESNLGYNGYFNTVSDKRIIINKKDLSQITNEDFEKIKLLDNVETIIENDLLIDRYLIANTENNGFLVQANNIDNYIEEIKIGRIPENDNEVLLHISKSYYLFDKINTLIDKEITIMNNEGMANVIDNNLKIVGISYSDEEKSLNMYSNNICKMYITANNLDKIRRNINSSYGKTEIEFNEKILQSYRVLPNSNVPEGKAYVQEELNYMTKRNNCINYNMNIIIKNLYFEDNINVKIAKTYNKKNMKNLLGIEEYDRYKGAIFVNDNQYYTLYDKENYQSSVYIKDEKKKQDTLQELNKMGYKTFYLKDGLMNYMGETKVFVDTIRIVISIVVMIILFFVSYFVIKLIMKSRNIYFSTLRILGATKKNAKELLKIELFTILNISYLITIGIIILIKQNIIKIQYLQSMITYINIYDIFILYAILFIISLLISVQYAKQLFKKSAMNTYREEA